MFVLAATENTRMENAARSKMQGWKTRSWVVWNAENTTTSTTVQWTINTRKRK